MCSMTFRLKKKNISTLKKLLASASLSSQDQFLQWKRSIDSKTSWEEIHSCRKYHFFLEKIEAMDSSESFFNRRTSAKRKWQCCFLSRGLEDKSRPENIAFPFIVKSLPGSQEARRIISIILWQSTLLVEEKHFLHFFSYENRLRNLDDEEKSTAVTRNEEDDT